MFDKTRLTHEDWRLKTKRNFPSVRTLTLTPQHPTTVIPSGAGRRFFFPSRSCEMVGLRSEESLLEFATVEARPTLLLEVLFCRGRLWRRIPRTIERRDC